MVSETWAAEFVPLIEPHGVYREGAQIPIVPDAEIDLDVQLDERETARKMVALQEHHSQLAGLVQVFGEDTLARAFSTETFCRR